MVAGDNIQVNFNSWFSTQIISAGCSNLLPIAKEIFNTFDFSACENADYPNGVTSYYTNAPLPEVENKDTLIQTLTDVCSYFAQAQGVDLNSHEVTLSNMWISRMYNGGKHGKHAHGVSHYSGTMYVSMPEGANGIRFYHPAEALCGLVYPPVSDKENPATVTSVDYSPNVGTVLIWNSWLYHEVLENHIAGTREAISFNFIVRNREKENGITK